MTAPDSDIPWQPVGQHRMRAVHDTVEIRIIGSMSLAEFEQFEQLQLQLDRTFQYSLVLADCSQAGDLSPQARRYIAEQARLHPHRKQFSAMYGCRPMTIVVVTLLSRAVWLFSGKTHPVELCRDEASAREILAASRRTFQAALAETPR